MAQIGACEAAIIALENVAPGIQGTALGNVGTVKALRDPDALQGLETLTENRLLGTAGAQTATVETDAAGRPIIRIRRYSNITAASVTTPTCSAAAAPAPAETPFTLTKYIQQSFSINVERLQTLCGDAAAIYNGGKGFAAAIPNTPIMNEIASLLRVYARKLVQDLDAAVLTQLVTGFGKNARTGAATASDITLYNADGSRSSQGFSQLMADYRINEGIGAPIILGGNKITAFMESLGYACCSNDGTDYAAINRLNPYRIYFDPRVDATLGADQFAVISAGAHKLVTANRYVVNGRPLARMANTSYGRVTFEELPGLQFDLLVDESGCVAPGYLFILSLSYDVFIPPAPYGTGDPLDGVNGMFRYHAVDAA